MDLNKLDRNKGITFKEVVKSLFTKDEKIKKENKLFNFMSEYDWVERIMIGYCVIGGGAVLMLIIYGILTGNITLNTSSGVNVTSP